MSTSQMLKGILEGCLLAIISEGEIYGYEMSEKLAKYGFTMASEGSIYPLLIRMQKEGLITSVMKESLSGPKRKYYTLTEKGEEALGEFMDRWEAMQSSVERLLEGKEKIMLSSEARKFLLDMRLFLMAKSVKESDIENFLEDAELHLIEGESEGKSVENIFGSSPKEYAHELVKVMERDRQETWKQIGFTVMNIVSFWIIASILIVNNGMLQISLIQCIGYSFSLILVVIGPNFLLRKMTFVTSFTKTWFSMWSLVMIAPLFLLGAVTILDVIYPTKMLTFTEVQSYIVAGGIFIITVAINIYFEGWFKNLYLIIPLSIM